MMRRRVRERQCDVVGRYVSASDGGIEHAPHDVFGSRYRSVVAGKQQTVAVGMDGDAERRFNGGKIAIVLSKEAHTVGELLQINGSLRGQPYRYSSCKPRGFPRTSAAMTARTSSGLLPKKERCLALCAAGGSLRGGSVRGGAAGRGGGGRGCGALCDTAGACARACSACKRRCWAAAAVAGGA